MRAKLVIAPMWVTSPTTKVQVPYMPTGEDRRPARGRVAPARAQRLADDDDGEPEHRECPGRDRDPLDG
jgi:hypothetical protein